MAEQGKTMDYMSIYYPESKFGGFTDIDGTMGSYTRTSSLIRSSSVVLDVGCGRGPSRRIQYLQEENSEYSKAIAVKLSASI